MEKVMYKVMVHEQMFYNEVFYSEDENLAKQFHKGISAFYDSSYVDTEELSETLSKYIVICIESNEGAANDSHVMYTTDERRHNTFISLPKFNRCVAHICLPFGDSTQTKQEAEQIFEEYRKKYIDYEGYIYIHADGTIERMKL